MSGRGEAHTVAVCFSSGGDVVTWQVSLQPRERVRLSKTLMLLLEFGQVASFGIEPRRDSSWADLIDQLEERCGEHVVQACLASPPGRALIMPAFVMPVWPFDHEIGGAPASTAQFLGLDLEVLAAPTSDEELGVHLPNHDGLWSIRAEPLSS